MTVINQTRMNIINLIMEIDDLQKLTKIEQNASLIKNIAAWNILTEQQFLEGYTEEDSIYDTL